MAAGSVRHRPPKAELHPCTPPVRDWMITVPGGPAVWPSIARVRNLIAAGCTHYVLRGDMVSAPGVEWSESCPLHPAPKPHKIGDRAAEPIGTLWQCDVCGTVWIARMHDGGPFKGGYVGGGPAQWHRATRSECAPLRRAAHRRLFRR